MEKQNDSAVHRALSILAWFNREQPTASASELSGRLDIPKSTVYRIINDLRAWGVIEREDDTNLYRLGPAILQFATAYSQTTSLSMIARPHVTALRDQTGETVSVNIIYGHERICILEARSIHPLNWSVPVGARGPLYAGSTGHAILAFVRPSLLSKLQESLPLEQITPDTPTSWDEVMDCLEEVRHQGHAITVGQVTPGVGGLAAPLLDSEKYSIGSVNLSAPLIRWDDETIAPYIPLIKEVARAISSEYSG